MRDIEAELAVVWKRLDAEEWIVRADPRDGSPVSRVPVSTVHDVDAAVKAGRAAFTGWAGTSAADRASTLSRIADAVAGATDELAWLTSREMGRSREDARASVTAGVFTLRQYAELGPLHRGVTLSGGWGATDFMVYEPRGLVAVVTPWNDPVAVSCGLIGAALVTGNAVVYKPSERTPATGWLLADLIRPLVPDGVFTSLAGGARVGEWLIDRDVDVVAHVGSTATGRRIARACALTGAKALLENGGKDALVIDEDVDPAWAASQAATGAFANAGQLCVAVERVFVHERIADSFIAELSGHAHRLGDLPLVDEDMRTHVHRHVAAAVDAGAQILTGGRIPDGDGTHYPATVLTGCTDEMAIMTEETFGPVAPVAVVASFDEGLRRAAGSRYGLAGTVLTGSIEHMQRGWRDLPVGTVKINNVFGGAPGGAAHPRRSSGQGYGYGPELLDEFTAAKVVHIEPPRTESAVATGG
jgi:acyl-CoA reductase-like NAD-dependent aldehyde dehydrogenase